MHIFCDSKNWKTEKLTVGLDWTVVFPIFRQARPDFFTWHLLTWLQSARFAFLLWSIGRIVCHITSKMGKTIAKLLCFGSFAGAWAQNEGLRRLKPCQLQITVQDWHCECDKLRPDATFQLLAVCGSWTRGHRANKPCLSRLQFQIWKFQLTMEVTGKFLVYYWRLVRDL